jgi:hypothetical protein
VSFDIQGFIIGFFKGLKSFSITSISPFIKLSLHDQKPSIQLSIFMLNNSLPLGHSDKHLTSSCLGQGHNHSSLDILSKRFLFDGVVTDGVLFSYFLLDNFEDFG